MGVVPGNWNTFARTVVAMTMILLTVGSMPAQSMPLELGDLSVPLEEYDWYNVAWNWLGDAATRSATNAVQQKIFGVHGAPGYAAELAMQSAYSAGGWLVSFIAAGLLLGGLLWTCLLSCCLLARRGSSTGAEASRATARRGKYRVCNARGVLHHCDHCGLLACVRDFERHSCSGSRQQTRESSSEEETEVDVLKKRLLALESQCAALAQHEGTGTASVPPVISVASSVDLAVPPRYAATPPVHAELREEEPRSQPLSPMHGDPQGAEAIRAQPSGAHAQHLWYDDEDMELQWVIIEVPPLSGTEQLRISSADSARRFT